MQALDFSVARLGCVIYNRRALDDGDKVTLTNSLLAPPPEMKEANLGANLTQTCSPHRRAQGNTHHAVSSESLQYCPYHQCFYTTLFLFFYLCFI